MMVQKMTRWIRFNLFATAFDTALTLLVLLLLGWAAASFFHWALELADWTVIQSSAKVLMTGLFPRDQLWRAWTATGLMAAIGGLASASAIPLRPVSLAVTGGMIVLVTLLTSSVSTSAGLWSLAISFLFLTAWLGGVKIRMPGHRIALAAAVLAAGALSILASVSPSLWGGLLLSILLTILAAVITIPIGVALALGRQSRLTSVRVLSVGYIELMRGVPLILIVYWIWIMTPLMIPSFPIPDIIRGLLGFVIFYSAYAAEYIRSGLQAVPRGQTEAAESLGFSNFDIKRFVVIPQAMRVATPGLAGNT